jgi:hypothetical protein
MGRVHIIVPPQNATEAHALRPYHLMSLGFALWCVVLRDTRDCLETVYQVVEHFGMHYGQIVFITKLVRGQDLGFYRELDKTGRRESH